MDSLIFFGSDQYSALVLATLLSTKYYHLRTIITDRPKPKGKDQLIESNPVEKLAIKHNLKVSYYPSNNNEMNNFISNLASVISHQSSVIGLSASFDHLLPPDLINLFNGRLYNLHPSLLPQYRNVAPVQYALALGEKQTGISLFKIASGIDNGEILAQQPEPILATDTTPTLTTRLFTLGAELFLSYLSGETKKLTRIKSPSPLIFTKRLTRDSGFVEWPALYKLLLNQQLVLPDTSNELLRLRLSRPPSINHEPFSILHALVRALTPWPSVWSTVKTKKGELRFSVVLGPRSSTPFLLHLAGKPNPITLSDFKKYYL